MASKPSMTRWPSTIGASRCLIALNHQLYARGCQRPAAGQQLTTDVARGAEDENRWGEHDVETKDLVTARNNEVSKRQDTKYQWQRFKIMLTLVDVTNTLNCGLTQADTSWSKLGPAQPTSVTTDRRYPAQSSR